MNARLVLLKFSVDEIKKAGYHTTTVVLVCNADDYENLYICRKGSAKQMNKLMICK